MSTESKLREQITTLGQSLFERGLTHGSTGNISVRLDDGWLMTPTNSCLGRLDPAHLSKLDNNGVLISGDAPTKEDVLHRAVYEQRPQAGAVVHLHSTHSVAVSCLPDTDANCMLPPLTAYSYMQCGNVAMTPYFRPGDPEMAAAVGNLAAQHTAIMLANHGPVVAGKTLEAAVNATEELEATAKLHLLLRGLNPRLLNEQQLAELDHYFPKS